MARAHKEILDALVEREQKTYEAEEDVRHRLDAVLAVTQTQENLGTAQFRTMVFGEA